MAYQWPNGNVENEKELIASLRYCIQKENADLARFLLQSFEQQQLNMHMHLKALETLFETQLIALEKRVQQNIVMLSNQHLSDKVEIKTSLQSYQQQLHNSMQRHTIEMQEFFQLNTQNATYPNETQESDLTKRHVEDILLTLYGKWNDTCAHFSFELSRNLNSLSSNLSTENIENVSACFRMDGNLVTTGTMHSGSWFVTVDVKNRNHACTLLTQYVSGELLQSVKKEIRFDIIQLTEAKVVPNEKSFQDFKKRVKEYECTAGAMVDGPNVTSQVDCVNHASNKFQKTTGLFSSKPAHPCNIPIHPSHTLSFLDSSVAITPPDQPNDQFLLSYSPSYSELQSKPDSESCSIPSNTKYSTSNVLKDRSTDASTGLSGVEFHHRKAKFDSTLHSDIKQLVLDTVGEQKVHINLLFLRLQRHTQLFSDIKAMESALSKEKAFNISDCYVGKA